MALRLRDCICHILQSLDLVSDRWQPGLERHLPAVASLAVLYRAKPSSNMVWLLLLFHRAALNVFTRRVDELNNIAPASVAGPSFVQCRRLLRTTLLEIQPCTSAYYAGNIES